MRKFTILVVGLFVVGLLGFTPQASAATSSRAKDLTRLAVKATPTDEQIGKAVLKAIGALVLHEASKPQRDDDVFDTVARGVARVGRDKLIDSALEDILPDAKVVERNAIRNLAILALDGKLSRDRDTVLKRLKRVNPDMADAVQVAEFLIQLAKAVDDKS
jgi:hypothetical protein